jgi:hypothetical protein
MRRSLSAAATCAIVSLSCDEIAAVKGLASEASRSNFDTLGSFKKLICVLWAVRILLDNLNLQG